MSRFLQHKKTKVIFGWTKALAINPDLEEVDISDEDIEEATEIASELAAIKEKEAEQEVKLVDKLREMTIKEIKKFALDNYDIELDQSLKLKNDVIARVLVLADEFGDD